MTNTYATVAGLVLALLSTTPAAACGNLDERCTYPDAATGPIEAGGTVDCAAFDPGSPGPGLIGQVQWTADAVTHSTCILTEASQDAALLHGGDVAWKLATVATGTAGLFDAAGLVPAAGVYQGAAAQVASSQVYDSCVVVLGPLCGADTTVDGTQQCPPGATIPNPVPGSLTGNTLQNGNAGLQATCRLAGAVNGGAPTQAELNAYRDATLATASGLNGDAFALASDLSDAACIFATGEAPCI